MTGQPIGRPRTLSDDDILGRAARAFAERGFDAVSLRDLNRALGVSHAAISRRFGSKEALWRAAVDHAFAAHRDEFLASVADLDVTAAGDLHQLRLVIELFLRTASRHPDLQGIINQEGATESERVDYLYTRCIDPLLGGFIRPLLDRLAEAGAIRAVTGREVFFVVANGAAAAFALAPLSRRFEAIDGPLDLDAYCRRVADLLLAGIQR